MYTAILLGTISVISLISLVISIIMLVKQFKFGGLLQGLLGLITCGFYTFIWGWIKHKQYAFTKIMVAWSVLMVASIVLPGMLAATGAMEMMSMFNQLKEGNPLASIGKEVRKKASKKMIVPKTQKKKKTLKPQAKTPALSTADWSKQALALWQDGKYADPNKAADYLTKSIISQPDVAETYNNRGLAYYDQKLYQRAIADYDRAIGIKPNYAVAYNNRGNAYYELAVYNKALTDFNRSLNLDPEYAMASMNRGLVYYQMNNTDQACIDFQKACDLGDCEASMWAKATGICK
jgi:Flp pilus assembly protein TadD